MKRRILTRLTAARILHLLFASTFLVLAGWTLNANTQTVTILYSFGGGDIPYNKDGSHPMCGLVQGSDGNFYGMTYWGGTNNNGEAGDGTVFRISASGSYTMLYEFGSHPNDGENPQAALVQGNDGNFYGTTYFGGASGGGTVFRISPSGNETVLYSFAGYPNDGSSPQGGLVQGCDSNFYGTTSGGGANDYGAVFRISPGGNETNLYSFVGPPNDGANPRAGLVQGSDGNFYGTTMLGGTNNWGTVFRISPGGSETVLYSFVPVTNGYAPENELVQGSDGNFYGTTYYGGASGEGNVFRISPNGSYTNLYSFVGRPTDGSDVQAGLVQGSDGNFYGTTYQGGASFKGTVFQISPSGNETNLYSFVGPFTDGENPEAGLVQGSDGNFYGTTTGGGTASEGTVFRLSVPLNPPPWPINQITGVQPSGSDIVFGIPSIAGETYQLQFSSSMNPTNWVNVPGVSVTNSIGALMTLTNFGGATGPQGFYRFAITP
jgi:uncharacterized repeat protein (TIGR03803 family)